ncbi:hypothetical protein Pen02_15290 [Plantactinospora endophytica]|uniref:Uncharacterized protein n=1 Tax=Plantactinospora endophytica TaxID=673535 RepID=A0ABQ4DVW7_9ACTN|nr:hypothetical protein Pen02_15290 [Plantactinospora endophytica]
MCTAEDVVVDPGGAGPGQIDVRGKPVRQSHIRLSSSFRPAQGLVGHDPAAGQAAPTNPAVVVIDPHFRACQADLLPAVRRRDRFGRMAQAQFVRKTGVDGWFARPAARFPRRTGRAYRLGRR